MDDKPEYGQYSIRRSGALLLALIGVAPWQQDNLLALKRVVILTLPASMSAALSDSVS